MKYKEGTLNFVGLNFSWKLITTEKQEGKSHEVFNIDIESDKTKIRQEFHNSIMEFEISELQKKYKMPSDFLQFKNHLITSVCKTWGGYDEDLKGSKIKNFKDFTKKRLWWLLYGVINDMAHYIDYFDYYDFNWFCDSYGYDKDSRKAEQIHKNCIEYSQKIESLKLSEKQLKYLEEQVNQETEEFGNDLKQAIEEQF